MFGTIQEHSVTTPGVLDRYLTLSPARSIGSFLGITNVPRRAEDDDREGFASKVIGQVSALPPDVRRWLCPAVKVRFTFGLCPRCSFRPNRICRA